MAFRFVEPRTRVGDGIANFAGATLSFFEFGTSTPKITFSDVALTSANTDPVVADVNGLFGDIFTDTQGTVTLRTSTAAVVYGPINFFAPEDGITTLAASNVAVLDSAGDFAADNVEAVLTEISDGFLRLNRINTVSAIQTFTAALQISDQELRRALLLDYAIVHSSLTQTTGTIDLDMTTANSFSVTLTENATITISNPPATGRYGQLVFEVTQDAGGGAFTITWPAGVVWPAATAPVMSTANGAIDEFTLRTRSAGTAYRGSFSQAFG